MKDFYVGQKIPSTVPHKHDGRIVNRKTWTSAEIDRMGADEFQRNLANPDFRAAIDGTTPSAEQAEPRE